MLHRRSAGIIPLGIGLFIAAFPLLFWNEGRAVKTARALAEGMRKVVSIDALQVDSTHENTLVHLIAEATTREVLTDPVLDVSRNALKLQRIVEMAQWRQSRAESSSHFDYRMEWSVKLIDSSDYPMRFQNPTRFPFASETFEAQDISVGAFRLSSSLLQRLKLVQPLRLSPDELTGIANKLNLETISMQTDASTGNPTLVLPYGGGDAQAPDIGDLRVRLDYLPATTVSVVAQQNGLILEPYTTRSGGTIALVKAGSYSATEMFDTAVRQNNAMTGFLRVLGFGIMLAGIRLLFSPLTAIAGFVPLLGGLMRFGATLIAGILALGLSLSTAALAWFSYRPLIAVPLLLIAVAGFYLLRQAGRHRPVSSQTAQQ